MANESSNALVLKVNIPEDRRLPDNATYQFRFQVKSESSNRLYIIAQNKSGLWWSCGCPGWIRHKTCKHLQALGLPGYHQPFEATLPAGK